jgi:hypothetical protein
MFNVPTRFIVIGGKMLDADNKLKSPCSGTVLDPAQPTGRHTGSIFHVSCGSKIARGITPTLVVSQLVCDIEDTATSDHHFTRITGEDCTSDPPSAADEDVSEVFKNTIFTHN